MFIYILFSLAFVALLQAKALSKYGHEQSRRTLMGGELARHLLDQLGSSQLAVESVSGWERFSRHSVAQLPLGKNVCEGKTLRALAEAGRDSVLRVRKHGRLLNFDQARRLWLFLELLIVPAWILLFLGLIFGWEGLRITAEDFFFLILVLALVDMVQSWEAEGQAYVLLKQSGYFEVDEMIKIRKLLEALRIERMMMIFKKPCVWAMRLLGRGEKTHGL